MESRDCRLDTSCTKSAGHLPPCDRRSSLDPLHIGIGREPFWATMTGRLVREIDNARRQLDDDDFEKLAAELRKRLPVTEKASPRTCACGALLDPKDHPNAACVQAAETRRILGLDKTPAPETSPTEPR